MRYPATVATGGASANVRIPIPAKREIDQLTIRLASKLGRRVTIPEVIAALVATSNVDDLAAHLRITDAVS